MSKYKQENLHRQKLLLIFKQDFFIPTLVPKLKSFRNLTNMEA